MSDRSSAEVFQTIFVLLAEKPTKDHKTIAAKIWPFTYQYDFDFYQMYCDDALVKLDLAEEVPSDDPRDIDEDGKPMMTYIYGPPGERE